MADDQGPVLNTDRELWRETPDDFYADSIHVTKEGAIGMSCGGRVIVMPIREWHKLATEVLHLTWGLKAPDEELGKVHD